MERNGSTIDAKGNVNLKPLAKYANLIDEADCMEFVTYRRQDEKFLLEQSETPSPPSAAIDLDVLWVDARKNKQCVIDNEKVQEVVNRVVSYPKKRESFYTADSQVIHEKALGLRQYPGRIRDAGFCASKRFLAPSEKRATKVDVVVLHDKYDLYDALLPIPVDEDTIIVRGALSTFVAWPIHLIDVVPIMGNVYAGHNTTSPPRIDEHAYKKGQSGEV
ncbi:hypothetical protein Lal_00031644 [Lupinus albus]|nr:hypothetical protein Lal_00031644 [Lupinus albus]